MPCAILLRPDDAVAGRVVAVWERLYTEGLDPTLLLPASEPAMPLAVYPDEVPADRLSAAVERLSASWTAMPLTVTGLGILGGLSPTLHLAVAPTMALMNCREQLHTALGGHSCDPRYRPGAWTPGIIISETSLSVAKAIRHVLPNLMQPIAGILVTLELVSWPSGTIIETWELSQS